MTLMVPMLQTLCDTCILHAGTPTTIHLESFVEGQTANAHLMTLI
jgi:hypothetical protein